jgi:hypothetical protein
MPTPPPAASAADTRGASPSQAFASVPPRPAADRALAVGSRAHREIPGADATGALGLLLCAAQRYTTGLADRFSAEPRFALPSLRRAAIPIRRHEPSVTAVVAGPQVHLVASLTDVFGVDVSAETSFAWEVVSRPQSLPDGRALATPTFDPATGTESDLSSMFQGVSVTSADTASLVIAVRWTRSASVESGTPTIASGFARFLVSLLTGGTTCSIQSLD